MSMILPPDELHERATRLRQHADELAEALAHIRPYHRSDVWRGRRAARFTIELAEHHRRLLGAVGVVPQLLDLAACLERQAAWSTLASAPPSPFTSLSSTAPSPFPPAHGISE